MMIRMTLLDGEGMGFGHSFQSVYCFGLPWMDEILV